jgi:pyruvate kinase
LHIRIKRARLLGSKLKADKGINFPQSNLKISGLTDKDRADLAFVTRHADVVNMSFVNTPDDISELLNELKSYNAAERTGIILKIETQQAFENLSEILLEAMQTTSIGVMIARGDLAIECGWENIGRIQEEILWMCQAAHVPTIWATQVLENLAKKGLPSRAEITDAVMAQRADCVMLNKGPYISRAISMLDTILRKMQEYQDKKAVLLPVLEAGREKDLIDIQNQ